MDFMCLRTQVVSTGRRASSGEVGGGAPDSFQGGSANRSEIKLVITLLHHKQIKWNSLNVCDFGIFLGQSFDCSVKLCQTVLV